MTTSIKYQKIRVASQKTRIKWQRWISHVEFAKVTAKKKCKMTLIVFFSLALSLSSFYWFIRRDSTMSAVLKPCIMYLLKAHKIFFKISMWNIYLTIFEFYRLHDCHIIKNHRRAAATPHMHATFKSSTFCTLTRSTSMKPICMCFSLT